jgi:uncharacterized protein YchJ
MRLSTAQIREGLFHPEIDVRSLVASHVSHADRDDPEVMLLAIEAIERFGWNDAFKHHYFMRELRQSDASVAWLLRSIELPDAPELDDLIDPRSVICAAILADAAPELLLKHESVIQETEALPDDTRIEIAERIELFQMPAEEIWLELDQLMARQTEDEWSIFEEEADLFDRLLDALKPHRDQFAARILAILNDRDRTSAEPWLCAATLLAGRLRLEAAVPRLVEMLDIDDEGFQEDAPIALGEIGSEAVVRALAEAYPRASEEFRYSAAYLLEESPSDACLSVCLGLAEGELDVAIRGRLLISALMNFGTEAIEPARQFILSQPVDVDVLETRWHLLQVSRLLNQGFPEFESWLEDSKRDAERRRRLFAELAKSDRFDEPEPQDWSVPDYGSLERSPTFVKADMHVGRNDPCPCGSGKKFKKCCYGKS